MVKRFSTRSVERCTKLTESEDNFHRKTGVGVIRNCGIPSPFRRISMASGTIIEEIIDEIEQKCIQDQIIMRTSRTMDVWDERRRRVI